MSSDILVPAGGSQPTVSVGVMLSNERVKRGISLQEVADQLKLSRKQIEALESDDFDRLPGVAFVRGFTRNYAKFLGLDPIPLMSALDVVLPVRTPPITISVEPAPAVDKESTPLTSKRKTLILMLGIAVLGTAGLFGVYASVNQEQNTKDSLSASAAKNEKVVPPVSAPAAAESAPSTASSSVAEPVATSPAVVVAPAAEAKPETLAKVEVASAVAPSLAAAVVATSPTVGGVTSDQVAVSAKAAGMTGPDSGNEIRLKVTQNSWLSVIDGNGKKLLYGEIAPGEERKLSGQPPFKLTIGNASGVALSYKGQPVDLVPSTKGATARLVLR